MKPRFEIAVIISANRPSHRPVVAGVARYARKAEGWSVYLEDESRAKMPDLHSWHGHGIIADLDEPAAARAVAGLKIPVVGVGGFAEPGLVDPPVPFVTTDNDRMGRIGAEHLMTCGLKQFAYFGVPRHRYNSWSQRRARAFVERLDESGFTCHVHTGRHQTPRRWEAFQKNLTGWLSSLPNPIGIMACNDDRARHLLEACRRLDLRVPHDVAILGVDNDPIKCELSIPPLSSVRQPAEEVGYQAAAILEQMMCGRKDVPSWTTVAPMGIAVRASTDFVSVRDPIVTGAIDYVQQHIGDHIHVTEIAEHLGVSRSTLDKHVHRALGCTIYDEITRLRLDRARSMLRSTDLPNREVAKRCGYANAIYLGFVFRKEMGMSPGKYRELARRDH